jgi:hypothetical protein
LGAAAHRGGDARPAPAGGDLVTIAINLIGLYTCWFIASMDWFTRQYRNEVR